jgi:hypothetical protein
MNFPYLPQRQERREIRYPLHLPVVLRADKKEMRARSENISLGGILLSSASRIAEGSAVEVAVGVQQMPDTGILLNARGKVLRVQQNEAGEFTLAIKLDRAFQLPRGRESARPQNAEAPAISKPKTAVQLRRPDTLAWNMET